MIGEEGLVSNVKEGVLGRFSRFFFSPLSHHLPILPAYKVAFKGRVYVNSEEVDALASPVSFVVIGSVHNEHTRNSERAANFVEAGAKLLYTCPDMFDRDSNRKLSFGMPMPLVNLITLTTNCDAYNLGKPNPHMIRMALKKVLADSPHLKWKDVLFVGDSIGTDIRTSIENGIDCCLVMSGTTTEEKLARSALMPNFVYPSVKELAEALRSGAVRPKALE